MEENKIFTSIGFMSGTSMDGVDCALIKTDGRNKVEMGACVHLPYDDEFVEQLRSVQGKEDLDDLLVQSVTHSLTDHHIKAVQMLMEENGLKASDIDVIGFHGQTIFHAPDRGVTVQIGDAKRLADTTGIQVVHDFRTADVEAGGQGAPLAPVYHRALVDQLEKPVAVVNIGGIANVTLIDEDGEISAFDTGMGNGLINDIVQEKTGRAYDMDGDLAANGTVDEDVLEEYLSHPYFKLDVPKSLDRFDFNYNPVEHLSVEDAAATLTAFTVQGIKKAIEFLPVEPKNWLITGGGRHNKTMMDMLQDEIKGDVIDVDTLGWRGDYLEAEAFAYMAVRHLLNLPNSFPKTTGCPVAVVGGQLSVPAKVPVKQVV